MFRLVSLLTNTLQATLIRIVVVITSCAAVFKPSKSVGVWKKLSLFFFVSVFFQAHEALAFRSMIGFWRSAAPTPMVMSWNTNNTSAGSSAANQAQLPLMVGSTYNLTVDWGDGASNTITSWSDLGALHTYGTAGTYTITLLGQVDRLYFNDTGDKLKILDVTAWGNKRWTSMASMFNGCANLTMSATDSPDLRSVTDMTWMLRRASTFNSDISGWNTSTVTNMSYVFEGASSFNQNLNSWNVGAVSTMYGMFQDAAAFNQNLNLWNTSSVTDMRYMFTGASVFNGNIGSWNTAAVTNMSGMFDRAALFNQDLNLWNTGAVTNMSSMFEGASSFNGNIGSWNTAAVKNMSYMFRAAISFNHDLPRNVNLWNTGAVINMASMFEGADAFNGDISTWNTGSVTNMLSMFRDTALFNGNISSWDTSAVTNMRFMFSYALAFNQDLSGWNVTAVGTNYGGYRTGATLWNSSPLFWPPGFL